MRLIHISDLHIGKRVNELSMLEDQEYILNQIYSVTVEKEADGVLIAGDVYDKSVPSAEAVSLLDRFLSKLSQRGIRVFIIGGNHDSTERLSFGSELMSASGVYISRTYKGEVESVKCQDSYGEVNIYMLPFVKPTQVRGYFDEEISSYTEALDLILKKADIDTRERNVLIAHQFVTGSKRSESEEICVGGVDNVDSYVFEGFDYVALGHIHSPQHCGAEHIRYSGTPLKYSFSEINDEKSVCVVDILEKGNVKITQIPLKPKRDMVQIKGKYNELMAKDYYDGTSLTEDYVRVILTDEEDILNALANLRVVYKNLLRLDYDNARTRGAQNVFDGGECTKKTPAELFAELYKKQNNKEMTTEQSQYINELIEEIWGSER